MGYLYFTLVFVSPWETLYEVKNPHLYEPLIRLCVMIYVIIIIYK